MIQLITKKGQVRLCGQVGYSWYMKYHCYRKKSDFECIRSDGSVYTVIKLFNIIWCNQISYYLSHTHCKLGTSENCEQLFLHRPCGWHSTRALQHDDDLRNYTKDSGADLHTFRIKTNTYLHLTETKEKKKHKNTLCGSDEQYVIKYYYNIVFVEVDSGSRTFWNVRHLLCRGSLLQYIFMYGITDISIVINSQLSTHWWVVTYRHF